VKRAGKERVRQVEAKRVAVSNVPAAWVDGVPYNAHRHPLTQLTCEHCGDAFFCPRLRTTPGARAPRRFCSHPCSTAWFAANGTFKGENNPRWLGGVAKDNMRYRLRQKQRHPLQEAARVAVHNALRRGEMVRLPCEVCGEPRSEGHHDDYTKPLDVRWLCRTHHVEHHNRERAA
jgi:hypothetical protein